ncbi:MAG: transporter substrate-binding domain-containing protein [Pseudomonadota bacterium]
MKRFMLIIIVFGILLMSANPAWSGDIFPGCSRILLSGNPEYPPLVWQDRENPGKVIGFAVELLVIALKETNVRVEAVYAGEWGRTQIEIRKGTVDMLGGAYVTEERKGFMDFIEPAFVMDPTVIFVRKGHRFPFSAWPDLKGLVGGAPIGNSYGQAFDSYAATHLTIERVPKVVQGFNKLVTGRNDYFVYGLYPGLAEAEVTGFSDKIDYLGSSVISEGLYYTISKRSPCNTPAFKVYLSDRVRELSGAGVPDLLMGKYLKLWKQQAQDPQ